MIKVYTAHGCISSRKVKRWFIENNIHFIEKNILVSELSAYEIRELLARTELGTDEIVSKRARYIKENNIDIDKMTFNQLVRFIQIHPTVLKRPIILDDKRFQVGYNPEEIRSFIPRKLRNVKKGDL